MKNECKGLSKKLEMQPAQHTELFLFSALCFTFLAGSGGKERKKSCNSEFPSLFKLIMGLGSEVFTMWNINYYFSIWPKVLGVNSLYCMKCQSNYCWSALFLSILSCFERHPVYWSTATSSQCFHSGKLLNRKGLDNAEFSKRRSGKKN